jgi:ApbE superfamily uncharacterized protein (UPF0280 family)
VLDLAEIAAMVAWCNSAKLGLDELEVVAHALQHDSELAAGGFAIAAPRRFDDVALVGNAETWLAVKLSRAMVGTYLG